MMHFGNGDKLNCLSDVTDCRFGLWLLWKTVCLCTGTEMWPV